MLRCFAIAVTYQEALLVAFGAADIAPGIQESRKMLCALQMMYMWACAGEYIDTAMEGAAMLQPHHMHKPQLAPDLPANTSAHTIRTGTLFFTTLDTSLLVDLAPDAVTALMVCNTATDSLATDVQQVLKGLA